MQAQRPAAALSQDLKIATRLSRLYQTEGEFLARHLKIMRIIAGDLQKDAAVGAAFVGLPGGMQEAWAKAETRRHPLAIAHNSTQVLQGFSMLGIALHICKQSAVVAGAKLSEMLF